MDWHMFSTASPYVIIILSLIVLLVAHYCMNAVKRPILISRDSLWRDFIQENMPILKEYYWPTIWCFETHLITIAPLIIRSTLPHLHCSREIVDLSDGGIISIDWFKKPNRDGQVIIVFLPGLVGSPQSTYIKGFLMTVDREDVDVSCVVFNHRGMASTELKTSKLFSAANSDDLEEAFKRIQSTYPRSPMVSVGVSFGGLVLDHYLVSRGEKAANYLIAALVISVSWNPMEVNENIEATLCNLSINHLMTRSMRRLLKTCQHQLAGDHPWDYEYCLKSNTIRQFDERFTVPNFGFKDLADYYYQASIDDKVENIRVPFICLTAADDIFQPLEGLPMSRVIGSSHAAIVLTQRGGHIGFLEGLFPREIFYTDGFFLQYINAIITNIDQIHAIREEGNLYNANLTAFK